MEQSAEKEGRRPFLGALISSKFTLLMVFLLSLYFLSISFSIRWDGNAYCRKENKENKALLFFRIVSEGGFFLYHSISSLI